MHFLGMPDHTLKTKLSGDLKMLDGQTGLNIINPRRSVVYHTTYIQYIHTYQLEVEYLVLMSHLPFVYGWQLMVVHLAVKSHLLFVYG